MMKKAFSHLALKTLLLLLLPLMGLTSNAMTYDFRVDDLYYQVISSNSVAVSGIDGPYLEDDYSGFYVVIPSRVSYNNVDYEVTAIADSAFYGKNDISGITIPETVNSIGSEAFDCCSYYLEIKCLSLEPPILNDYSNAAFLLLVREEAYNQYQEAYGASGCFEHILCFDGTPSTIPTCEVYEYGDSKGVLLVFENCGDDTEIYRRQGFRMTLWYGWSGWELLHGNEDVVEAGTVMPQYFSYEAFAIVDAKYFVPIGDGFTFRLTCAATFDIDDGGIAYEFIDDPLYLKVKVSYYGSDDGDKNFYYSGDIEIPEFVHFAKWDYEVVSIGYDAFSNCVDLNSVSIPATIENIEYYAFTNCPNLAEITCLGTDPPSVSDDFSDQNYQNVTLRVPRSAVETYRNAWVWCNFQNIVGFYDYDFEQDGLYYKITNNGGVSLTTGPEPYSGSMMVPTEVTYEGVTYAVTGIVNGTFANAELSNLYLPVTIGNIGDGEFAGCNIQSLYITGAGSWQAGALNLQVNNLFIDSGVTGLAGMQVDASSIYCFATVPPACDDQTFQSYNADLHVPASSLAAYFTAPYWCNFLNIIGDAVELTEFTLSDSSLEMPVGGQATLRVTIKPNNATTAEVTWSSSNEAVATVTGGVVTGIAAGECDIIAISQSQRAVCHVVVYDIPATGITISQETAKMEMGTQLTLTATVLPEDATDKTVTWLSDNEAVATVADGVVTAVGTGECNITANCGELQATCHVIVVEHLISITLDEHEISILPNHIIILTPTISPVSTDLVVTSTNPNVAAVRLAGNKIQVVGIAEGTTTIYVNSTDGYAEGDSCEVTVITEIGDVNNDGYVDINDVTILIDRMLGKNQPINFENADVNYDGTIDINDITELIGFLLGVSQLEPKDHHIVPYTVNGVMFKMVRVTGGTFMMGATPEQGENTSDKEKPVHQVTLSSFSISQTEVTQELWEAVMGANPSYHTGDMQCPVECVSWNDCQAFIAQLNQLTGEQFRLPTEAEWEFAARGGNKSQGTRYAGSNNIDDIAWYNANSSNTTHPVALKAPNELGLFDMTGNVWEWCNDWYKRYTAEAQTDPTGPETGNNRVLRGGCWNGDTNYNRISYRDNFTPTGSNSSGGLRLAL